jgi:hypothetical protein
MENETGPRRILQEYQIIKHLLKKAALHMILNIVFDAQ